MHVKAPQPDIKTMFALSNLFLTMLRGETKFKNNNALFVFPRNLAEWNAFCPEPTYVTIHQTNHNMFICSYEPTSDNELVYDIFYDCSRICECKI